MTLTDEALSYLLRQFDDSTRLKAIIRTLVEPFTAADEELHKLHHGRYIDNAQGATLDVIGSIVGQQRINLSDEDYLPWIKVGICLNNGNGTPESVLTILHILFGKKPSIRMDEYASNDIIFTFFEIPKFPLATLFAIVRSAVPVTTKCQFIRADTPAGNNLGISMLKATDALPAFRLDFTAFSTCYFADFFEGESDER